MDAAIPTGDHGETTGEDVTNPSAEAFVRDMRDIVDRLKRTTEIMEYRLNGR